MGARTSLSFYKSNALMPIRNVITKIEKNTRAVSDSVTNKKNCSGTIKMESDIGYNAELA